MKLDRDKHVVSMPVTDYELIINSNYEKSLYDDALQLIFLLMLEYSPNMSLEHIKDFFKKRNIEIELSVAHPAAADKTPEIIIRTLKYIKEPVK